MRVNKISKILLFAAFLFIIRPFTYSQENIDNDTSTVKNIKPELVIHECKAGLVKVDGVLDEAVWKDAPVATNFVEIEPDDNTTPPVKTEVKIIYDEDNLYFGFICYDDDMSKLVANMTDRDKIFNDDFVGLILDTYRDYKHSYEFYVNPYGIQGDLTLEPNNEDTSPDYIWEGDSKIYNDRWTAEIAIPFKSIRFPDKDEVSFGVDFIRTRPRDSRLQMSWVVLSRDNPSILKQLGVIKGIKNVKSGKNLEILPYVIGSVSGYLRDEDPSSKFVADSLVKGDAGINVKYGFTSNLTGEIAVNPDFSQVESDATVIDVNTTNAIQYPEKRPLFLEGGSIFRTSIQMFYSRMINDPLYAAKLTGKIGDYSLGYILAYDENTPFIVPYDYGSFFVLGNKLKSLSNVIRVKRDLKGESFVGLSITDREIGKSYNRDFSFDGSINFLENYYVNWQMISYNTRELNDTNLFNRTIELADSSYKIKFDGEKFSGFGGYVSFVRNARTLNFNVNYYETPPEARRDLGYIGSVNWRELNFWGGYYIYPEKSLFLKIEPQVSLGADFRHNTGKYWQAWVIPQFYMLMNYRIDLSGGFLAVNNEEYKGVFHKGVHRGWINFNINTSDKINGGGYIEIGKYIVRFETPSFVGFGINPEIWLTIKPTSRLAVENNYSYSELSDKYGGSKLYAGYVYRNKTTYQFTRNLFLRLILQYDSFSKRVDIDPLLSFKWNPFTIFYIGSTHIIYDYGQGEYDHSRFVESNRQFFAKFQYLFRM